MNEQLYAPFSDQLLYNILHGHNDEAKSMINKKLARAHNGFGTLLHYAALYGNDVIVAYLIEMGSEIDAMKRNGRTPLMEASKLLIRAAVIKLLLDAGANINVTDANGRTPLQLIFNSRLPANGEVYRLFYEKLQSESVSIEDLTAKLIKTGWTLYHLAYIRDFDLMESMLKSGVDVESRNRNEMTAMHAAVELNDLELAKWLIAKGANLNVYDRGASTPLVYAAMKINKTLIQLLLEHGADPNFGADSGVEVPLFTLAMDENENEDVIECMELLMQWGAIPGSTTCYRRTIFDYALDNGNFVKARYLVAQLALFEKMGKLIAESVMQSSTQEYQTKMEKLTEYYKLCEKVLGVAMFQSFSLFALLTRESILRRCVRNETFVSKIEKICSELELRKLYPYYFNTLMKRIDKAADLVGLEDIAIPIVCGLLDAHGNEYDIAARQIVGYLDERELGQFTADSLLLTAD